MIDRPHVYLHVPTVVIVIAAMVTGSLLTVAGVTMHDSPTVPTVGIATGDLAYEQGPSIGDPWAWAACVETVYATGGGSDADLSRCDRRYPVDATVRAECRWNAGEGRQDWPAEDTVRCTWTTEPRS